MQDAETRALRRAAILLLVVSVGRLAWGRVGDASAPSANSVLPALVEAVDEAVEEQDLRARPLAEGERIDPNRASAAELDRLPGIGPSTAEAVVGAREDGVVFRRPEDLERVRGIGPAMVRRIGPLLDLSVPPSGPDRRMRARRGADRHEGVAGGPGTPVDLNRATAAELQKLPGVGPALAERILVRRRARPFATVDELVEVRGIGPATLERIRPRATVRGPPRPRASPPEPPTAGRAAAHGKSL